MLQSKSRTQKKKFWSDNSLPCWKSISASSSEQQEESQVFSVILAGEQSILRSNRRDIISSWVFFDKAHLWPPGHSCSVLLSRRRCLNLKLFLCCTSEKWILSTWFSVDEYIIIGTGNTKLSHIFSHAVGLFCTAAVQQKWKSCHTLLFIFLACYHGVGV